MTSTAPRHWRSPARPALLAITIGLLLPIGLALAQSEEPEEFPRRFLDHEILAKGQVREVDAAGTVIRLIEGEIGLISPRDIATPGNRREVAVDLSRARGQVKFEDTDEVVSLRNARHRLADALYVEIARMPGRPTKTQGIASGPEPRNVPGLRRGPEPEIPPMRNLIVDGWVWIRVVRMR